MNVKGIPLRDEVNISQKGMRANTNPAEVMVVFARNRVENIVTDKVKIIKYHVNSAVIDVSHFTRLEFDVVSTCIYCLALFLEISKCH